ncbi:MAG: hypothetical protein MI750_11410 [Xanthomonadales bacterium]|nr:hypothetical protein [Xanthomonadales bacterium]
MNCREYDYNLGRFYSVDPFIQFPENSQSVNGYFYILNNTLSGTDPSGYLGKDLGEAAFLGGVAVASAIFFSPEEAQFNANAHALIGDDDQALAIAAGQALTGNEDLAQTIAHSVLAGVVATKAVAAIAARKNRRGGNGNHGQSKSNGGDKDQGSKLKSINEPESLESNSKLESTGKLSPHEKGEVGKEFIKRKATEEGYVFHGEEVTFELSNGKKPS